MSQTELVVALLDEGLKIRAFPGIVYREGPTGRRAALAVGPDVWEVIGTVKHVSGAGERKVGNAARMLSLDQRWVRLAIEFYSAFPGGRRAHRRQRRGSRAAAGARLAP